jgi:hypothetical protein
MLSYGDVHVVPRTPHRFRKNEALPLQIRSEISTNEVMILNRVNHPLNAVCECEGVVPEAGGCGPPFWSRDPAVRILFPRAGCVSKCSERGFLSP